MRFIHLVSGTRRTFSQPFFAGALLSFVLAVVLAACGSGTGAGSTSTGSSSSPNPTSTPTTVKGYGTSVGCPSNLVVSKAPATPGVVVKPSNSTVTVASGAVIEILLPFGQQWSGPGISEGVLELQQPYGYASKAQNGCIWQFIARGTGTTILQFTAKALCKPTEVCPMYIRMVPFTINVK